MTPGLAAHVQTFLFDWNPDWFECGEYIADDDTRKKFKPLDVAFSNRWQIWADLAAKVHAEIQHIIVDSEFRPTRACFVHNGIRYCAPGDPPLIEGHDPKEVSSYDWNATTWGGEISGPDGKGEDRLIKTANDFNECVTEVFRQLTALENFGWWSSAVPMPRAAFNALAKLTKRFHVQLRMDNGDIHPREYDRCDVYCVL